MRADVRVACASMCPGLASRLHSHLVGLHSQQVLARQRLLGDGALARLLGECGSARAALAASSPLLCGAHRQRLLNETPLVEMASLGGHHRLLWRRARDCKGWCQTAQHRCSQGTHLSRTWRYQRTPGGPKCSPWRVAPAGSNTSYYSIICMMPQQSPFSPLLCCVALAFATCMQS